MTDAVPPPLDDELGALLSAYLDGEVTDAERARVDALVADDPAVAAELDALGRVRSAVRSLPPVEPPFGALERAVLAGRREERAASPDHRRRHWGGVASAVAAAAAVVVLVLGVTPASDGITPPVAAFAARHVAMDEAADRGAPPTPTTSAPMPGGSVAGTTTPTSAVVGAPGTPSTAGRSAGSTAGAGTTASAAGAPAAVAYTPLAPAELDGMAAPYEVPTALAGGWSRLAGYHAGDGTVHVVYQRGRQRVSVYEQVGTVHWSELPSGQAMQVGGNRAWATDRLEVGGAAPGVVVVERAPLVFTVVAEVPHDDMVAMAAALPAPASPSLVDRGRSACAAMTERFGLGAG